MSAYPSKVMKGKKMAGQYGNATVTVQNLKVVKVDVENNLLLIKGAVPGPKNGYIVVKSAIKK
jgi:large subunit ribosomal protein L3